MHDSKGASGVESVPSDPQDEGSEDLKGGGVPGHVLGDIELVPLVVVKAADTRAEDDGSEKSRAAARQVDNSTSGKVNDSNVEDLIVGEGGKESAGGPHGVGNNGVDKGCQEGRVAQVGNHCAAFRDGSGHDGGSSSGEGELEEPALVVVNAGAKEEVLVPDEGDLRGISPSVSKAPSECPEADSSSTGVEKVLQHDVLGVLGTNTTSTQHGESRLHEENHGSTKNAVQEVEDWD